jgi:hypothetical protein
MTQYSTAASITTAGSSTVTVDSSLVSKEIRINREPNTLYEYELTVVDLRPKNTIDNDRLKLRVTGWIECKPNQSIRDKIVTINSVALSKIENIDEMYITHKILNSIRMEV